MKKRDGYRHGPGNTAEGGRRGPGYAGGSGRLGEQDAGPVAWQWLVDWGRAVRGQSG